MFFFLSVFRGDGGRVYWVVLWDWTGAGAASLFGIQAAVFHQSSGQLFVSGPNGTGDTVCGKCKYSEVMDVIKVTSVGKQLD